MWQILRNTQKEICPKTIQLYNNAVHCGTANPQINNNSCVRKQYTKTEHGRQEMLAYQITSNKFLLSAQTKLCVITTCQISLNLLKSKIIRADKNIKHYIIIAVTVNRIP